jgi:hypothetical protein
MSAVSATPYDDAFAWDVIAQVAALLAPVADGMGGAVMAAFEVVEDALAERHTGRGPIAPIAAGQRGGTDAA